MVVSKDTFENEVLKSQETVLVDFYADWCGPCQMIAPILKEISDEDICKVCKVNVDDEMELAIKYGISSIPALLVFKEGKLVNRAVGYRTKEQILEIIK